MTSGGPAAAASSPTRRPAGLAWAWSGAILGAAALLTYFLVIPGLSTELRDSGHLNVAAGALGVFFCLIGLVKALRAGAGVFPQLLCFLATGAGVGFLGLYIYVLSYDLPPPERAIAVGARAPDFRLKDQTGIERSLADYPAPKLVLVFFRGHW